MSFGARWVRAIYLDPEVRADWEKYLADLNSNYLMLLQDERDEVNCRWLQGKLQALEELTAFVERTMVEYKKADQSLGDQLPS